MRQQRELLREALSTARSPLSLKEVLLEIPDVGEERDFERAGGSARTLGWLLENAGEIEAENVPTDLRAIDGST